MLTAPLSLKMRTRILERDDYTCQKCGHSFATNGTNVEVDHILPRAQGGTNAPENLLTRCFACNRGKGDCTVNDDGELVDNAASTRGRTRRNANGYRAVYRVRRGRHVRSLAFEDLRARDLLVVLRDVRREQAAIADEEATLTLFLSCLQGMVDSARWQGDLPPSVGDFFLTQRD